MTLRQLIKRLGVEEVARRVGVSGTTVKRWTRQGVSGAFQDEVREAKARHERSLRAAATKKKHARVKKARQTRKARDVLQEEIADAAGLEDPSQAPRTGPKPSRVRDYQKPGRKALDTFRYEGETFTFTVGQPVATISADGWAQQAVRTWQDARPFRDFCRVIFLFFRFVSRGSREEWYRGKLVPKSGRWFDFWTSTKAWSSADAIHDSVVSAIEASDSRGGVVWLEQMQVNVFEWKEDQQPPDVGQLTRMKLHATE